MEKKGVSNMSPKLKYHDCKSRFASLPLPVLQLHAACPRVSCRELVRSLHDLTEGRLTISPNSAALKGKVEELRWWLTNSWSSRVTSTVTWRGPDRLSYKRDAASSPCQNDTAWSEIGLLWSSDDPIWQSFWSLGLYHLSSVSVYHHLMECPLMYFLDPTEIISRILNMSLNITL